MANRLYPQDDEPTFEQRWNGLPVEQPTWQEIEAQQNLAARGEPVPLARDAFQAKPAGRPKLTPVEGNPFSESPLNPVNIYNNIRNSKRSPAGMAFDLATDNFIVNSIKSGVTLPRDVISGEVPLRDAEGNFNPTVVERALDTAGLAAAGAFATRPGTATLGSGPVRASKPVDFKSFSQRWEESGVRNFIADRPSRNEIQLSDLVVQKDQQGKGIGTKYMNELTSMADENGRTITLTPGQRDPHYGTTSQSRLKEFYKEFGFVENKGRNKDYTISDTMYRKPILKADTSETGAAIAAAKSLQKAPRFYSAVENAVVNNPQAKATGDQWLATIQNARGVKPEELDWIGLREFLQEHKGKPVTREQVQEHINNNRVEIKEVSKRAWTPMALDLDGVLRKQTFEINTPADIAQAKKFNANFRETVKGMTDEQIQQAINETREFQRNSSAHDLPKYKDYQLPGGENYREMLLTLPGKKQEALPKDWVVRQEPDGGYYVYNSEGQMIRGGDTRVQAIDNAMAEAQHTGKNMEGFKPTNYRSSHWSEPNVLAHVRMNDRSIDGKKSLHLEEIQSDWHQAGRDKGYKVSAGDAAKLEARRLELETEGGKLRGEGKEIPQSIKDEWADVMNKLQPHNTARVPDAPFKKTWHELALKRMLREAAERGYERLSWTPGEAQAARYDLSKQIDKINVIKTDKGYLLAPERKGTEVPVNNGQPIAADQLASYIGKDLAEKIVKNEKYNDGGLHVLENVDLKIGGEGMTGFYDNIIPKSLEKIGKEWGVKVQRGELPKDIRQYEIKATGILDKNGNELHSVYDDKGRLMADFKNKKDASEYVRGRKAGEKEQRAPAVFYINIPPQMRETINTRGMPLFAGGLPFVFVPVDYDPWANKK